MKNNLQEIKKYWILALPSILELLLTTFVQYVDMALVGRIGANASAAVGLTAPLIWLINSPQYALGLTLQSFVAFNIGKDDKEQLHKVADQSLVLVLALGLAEGLLFTLSARAVPGIMGADPAIRSVAGTYFLIVSAPMLFRTADIVFGSMLRGTGDMRTPMLVNLLMNIVNVLLNLIMIYPASVLSLGGFELHVPGLGLGVVGSGIATAVSYVIGGTVMFIAVKRNVLLRNCKIRRSFSFELTKSILRKATPIALTRIGVSLGHVTFTGLITGLGTIPLAAHSIAMSAEEFFYVPGYGMQAVAATLTGNALGEGNSTKAKKTAGRLIGMSVLMLALLCVVLYTQADKIMDLFTDDPAVRELGAKVLRIVSVSEPIFAVFIILEGVFNGAGYTQQPFYIGIFCMWCIRILGSYICIRQFHLGLQAVWVLMVADNVARATLLSLVYVKGKWTGEQK